MVKVFSLEAVGGFTTLVVGICWLTEARLCARHQDHTVLNTPLRYPALCAESCCYVVTVSLQECGAHFHELVLKEHVGILPVEREERSS